MTACILAIDLGTGGPKVALVGGDGRALAWSSERIATTLLPDGGAEQDPEEMWRAIVVATRSTLRSLPSIPPIAAVAVTSQYMSTIPVAADGRPTGPCILWMDTRGADHNLSLLTDETFMLWVERHGLIPLPSGNDNIAHAHVLETRHPDSYGRAAALVEPMDYVNARLTGRVRATQSTVFGQLVCDNRTWGAVDYDPELVAAARLDPDKLAPLGPMNGFVGEVTSLVASELGIPAGTPVAVGTIDSITSAIGSGATGPHAGSIIIGTTAVMVSHIGEHRGDLTSGLLAVPSPLPGRYYVMAENGVGGRALEWAARLFGYGEDIPSALADAASVGSGADGVQFMPWLLGSIAPAPDDEVRAAFTGLHLRHDRRHFVRATIDGVALNLAWLLPHLERFIDTSWPFLRFGGGGALSDLWAQALADALDRPVHQLAEPRVTNARGAALLALVDLGEITHADLDDLVEVRSVRDPDPASRSVMDAALHRLSVLHPALGSIARS